MHDSAVLSAQTERKSATEHLYYPSPTGYVFATDNLDVYQQMPFYGMVLISTGNAPICIRTGDQSIEGMAVALWAKDVHFIMPQTSFVSIAVNPLHPLFRAFAAIPAPHAALLDHARYGRFGDLMRHATEGRLTHAEALTLFDDVLAASRDSLPVTHALDSRAQILMKMLWHNPRCSLAELAQQLNLSYHRTSHFFAETVGLTVRTYQLWQKLYKAGAPLMAGASLTDTAHAAGFVDSAHYSRAFQTAFGRCPTEMFKTRRTKVFFSGAFREVPMFNTAAKR
jgi:AraC-like DNA-binding protein